MVLPTGLAPSANGVPFEAPPAYVPSTILPTKAPLVCKPILIAPAPPRHKSIATTQLSAAMKTTLRAPQEMGYLFHVKVTIGGDTHWRDIRYVANEKTTGDRFCHEARMVVLNDLHVFDHTNFCTGLYMVQSGCFSATRTLVSKVHVEPTHGMYHPCGIQPLGSVKGFGPDVYFELFLH